jgi:DNA-binding transcriptional regulator GbsR (MarR family)
MSNAGLTLAQRGFIDEIAALLRPWGMPSVQAQLYACLLIAPEPLGLDAIAATLGIAKSSASVAARALEGLGLARRYGERGSKRVRYGASERYSGFIAAQATAMGELARMLETRGAAVAEGDTLRRLRYLASFYRKMDAAISGRIRELTEEFQGFSSWSDH